MGQSATSASFPLIQQWEERLAGHRVVLLSRGTRAGWRRGLAGTLWSSTRRSAKSKTWGRTTPGTGGGSEAAQVGGLSRGGWTRRLPEVPSNLSHPVILRYSSTLLCVSTIFLKLRWPKLHCCLYGTHSDYYHQVRNFLAADDHLEQLKP